MRVHPAPEVQLICAPVEQLHAPLVRIMDSVGFTFLGNAFHFEYIIASVVLNNVIHLSILHP